MENRSCEPVRRAGHSGADIRASFGPPETLLPKEAGLSPNQVWHGEIIRWENDKGYGFIRCGNHHVFFHISAYHYRHRRPQIGEAVSFFCSHPAGGSEKQRAARVVSREDEYALNHNEVLVGAEKMHKRKTVFYTVLGAAYLVTIAFFCRPLAVWYSIVSISALILYKRDKTIAKESAGRSGYIGRAPEATLFMVNLLGGWPGALMARFLFNHKTTKQPFVMQFWLTAVMNVLVSLYVLQSGSLDALFRFIRPETW